jgi:hypothetical protein
MKVQRSKSGLPTLTENGGGMSNTGYATLVCGENGQKLKPLFVPRGYSNKDHAIFVVHPGKTHLVHASTSKSGETVTVEKITDINDDDEIITVVIGEYENGDGTIQQSFNPVVSAALQKTRCYHCREPHYIK